MGVHTVVEAEAREQLSELIDRAMGGEEVRISREGGPILELRVMAEKTGSQVGSVEWFRSVRVTPRTPGFDSVALLREVRDEGL